MKLSEFKGMRMTDLMTKTTDEIKKLVQWGAKMLNPRINRLQYGAESKRIADDAYRYIEQTGGLFSTVSSDPGRLEKTRNELLAELKREMDFSRMETSSVTGARQVKKEREDILRKNYSDEDLKGKSQDEMNDLLDQEWEKFRKYNEEHGVLYKQGKTKELYQMYMSDDEVRKQKEREYDISERERKLLEEVEKSTAFRPKWQF